MLSDHAGREHDILKDEYWMKQLAEKDAMIAHYERAEIVKIDPSIRDLQFAEQTDYLSNFQQSHGSRYQDVIFKRTELISPRWVECTQNKSTEGTKTKVTILPEQAEC